MEQVIEIIMGDKDISELDKIEDNSEKFIRWKNVLLLFIKQSKLNLQRGFTRENIVLATNEFDDFFSKNQVLNQFINGENLENSFVEQQIIYFYDNLRKKLGIDVIAKQDLPEGQTIESSKTLTKSNGHSLLEKDKKSKGYVGAFLMASLTASIELATVAYILLNGM